MKIPPTLALPKTHDINPTVQPSRDVFGVKLMLALFL